MSDESDCRDDLPLSDAIRGACSEAMNRATGRSAWSGKRTLSGTATTTSATTQE